MATFQTIANPAANNTNSGYVRYPDLNQLLVQGRLLHAEKVANNQGQFVAVTLVTTTKKGDETGMAVVFNSSALVEKFDAGWLIPGRRLTVTGKVAEIRTHYTKGDQLVQLKRPELKLYDGNVAEFGATPRANRAN